VICESIWGNPLPEKALPSPKHLSLIPEGPKGLKDIERTIRTYWNIMDADVERLRGRLSDEENKRLEKLKEGLLRMKFDFFLA
jgi:hypothetical protein